MKAIFNEVKQSMDLDKTFILIAGNKNDLYNSEQIKKPVAEQFVKSIKGNLRIVSALENTGISELFSFIAENLMNKGTKKKDENKNDGGKNEKKEFSLNNSKKDNKEEKKEDFVKYQFIKYQSF